MIADLNPYTTMKDSGLPWAPSIPSHWDVIPNRAFLRKRKVLVGERHIEHTLLSLTKAGVIVRDVSEMRGKFSADMGTSQEVRNGDLVFCLFDIPETPRTVGLSQHDGMITGAYTVFESCDKTLARYLEAFYIAMDDRKLLSPLYSGLRNTIPPSTFLGTKTPVPSPDEQAAIVRFLDHADRRIRRYIRAKQKLIKLLEEQKQAIIHRAVTRGLDPNFRLKPSGVEWLGNVPEHWEVVRSKRVFRRRTELARPGDVQLSATQAYGVISQEEFERRVGRKVTKIFKNLDKRRHVEVNDFVISMRSFQGGLERAWESGCIRSSYVVLKPAYALCVSYFARLFKSRAYIAALQATADFIRDGQDLNFDNFCAVDLPWPPFEEQMKIAAELDVALERSTTAGERARREISFLREYRTRLIADVVTGKLDVRKAAARLPDRNDVPEPLDEIESESGTEEADAGDIDEAPEEAKA